MVRKQEKDIPVMENPQTLTAGHCLGELENLINRAMDGNGRLNDALLKIVDVMQQHTIVGVSPEEMKRLRRTLVEDAIKLGLVSHVRIRQVVRKLARDAVYNAPRAASISGATGGHPYCLPLNDRLRA
jgi:hypothetical protein